LVTLDDTVENWADNDCTIIESFSLYNELYHRIKASLKSGRNHLLLKLRCRLTVLPLMVGFEFVVFKDFSYMAHNDTQYLFFKDLNRLLGSDWHVRGIDRNGVLCYIILNTVEFYLYTPSTTEGVHPCI